MPIETLIKDADQDALQKVAAAGYCFGAKYVVRFLRSGLIDVGFIAHPAMIDRQEVEGVRNPLAMAAAEIDNIFPADKRYETEKTLKKLGIPYQINLYSGVQHGFAVRCDLSARAQKYAKESAFLLAVQWFEEHLA